MKKILMLFIVSCIFIGCSSKQDNNVLNKNKANEEAFTFCLMKCDRYNQCNDGSTNCDTYKQCTQSCNAKKDEFKESN